jgi:serine/threonine-protein kinase
MGRIFRAQNRISHRIDAMKVLLPGLPKEAKADERFTREIEVLARLDHPNITALRTAARFDDSIVMIMEYVDGITLEKQMKQGDKPLEENLDYIRQTALALAYAHERGVVHRDIKPSNIMITHEGKVKLMDFGIAKVVGDHRLTMTGVALGSIHYMSPEQIQNVDGVFDQRSDIYSLGIVLYETATGQKPYDGETQYAILDAHLHGNPATPISLRPDLPPGLNEVILKAMARDPFARYTTAMELWEALRNTELGPTRKVVANADRAAETVSLAQSEPVQCASPAESPRGDFLVRHKLGTALLAVFGLIATSIILVKAMNGRIPGSRLRPEHSNAPLLSTRGGDMAYVAGGNALLGVKRTSVFVKSFYIDITEVTNQAFLEFCHSTDRTPAPNVASLPGDIPVVNVTFDDAQTFCGWASKRLPTAEEWEKAARGSNGQAYPWGDTWDYARANIPKDDAAAQVAGLAPVNAYPSGRSPYGALNLLGNVWEWVNMRAEAPEGQEFEIYQQKEFPHLIPPLSRTEPYYQIRGGSFAFVPADPAALIWDWSPVPERAATPQIGFRCAKDVVEP